MYVARRDHRDPGCGSSSLVVWPELAIMLSISHYNAATLTLVLLRGCVLLSQSSIAKIAAL